MEGQQLKFGILCNSSTLPLWQANAILELLRHPSFKLCLIIQNNTQQQQTKEGLLQKLFSSTLLFRQYETRFLKLAAKKPVDMTAEFSNTPIVKVTPIQKGKYSLFFSDDDVATINNHNLDFIIRFGFGILKGEILNAAKYGIWSFHHGDEQHFRGGPPGFWEIFYKKPVTAAILQRLTPTLDGGVVMKKGYFKTIHHSYAEQVDTLFTHTSGWIKQVGLDILHNAPTYPSPQKTKTKIHKAPINSIFILFVLRLLYNKISFKLNSIFRVELWRIGTLNNTLEDVLQNKPLTSDWWVDKQKLSYRADPFITEINGQSTVFFERFDYHSNKGHIASQTANNSVEKEVIKNNKHYSYPYIFKHNGNTYCLPECFECNGVELYQLDDEGNFVLQKTILQGLPVVDPTLLYHNNKFWLFFTLKNNLPNAQLYIYYADDLMGEYTPHLQNPVKTDISSSRPAGGIFSYNSQLIRPAQNCSLTYGGSLVLNKITTLTETLYTEDKLTEILPLDGKLNKGIHHISTHGNTIIVDGKKYIYSLQQALKRIVGQ